MDARSPYVTGAAAYGAMALALMRCTFLPGCWDKRFVHGMGEKARRAEEPAYTPKQKASLLRLVHKYRRQLPTAAILMALDQAEDEFDDMKDST